MEDPNHVRSARKPFGRITHPKLVVASPDVTMTQRRRPWVLRHEREAKHFLASHGPLGHGRLDHIDRGLREWTPKLHEEEILPYLRRCIDADAAAQKPATASPAARKGSGVSASP